MVYPKSIRCNRIVHEKPSILGYDHLWKPPFDAPGNVLLNQFMAFAVVAGSTLSSTMNTKTLKQFSSNLSVTGEVPANRFLAASSVTGMIDAFYGPIASLDFP